MRPISPDKPRRIKLRDPERGKTLVIREAPNDCQNSVLHDPETGRHHVIPFRPSAKAKVIHAKLGLDTSVRPYGMTTDGKGVNSA